MKIKVLLSLSIFALAVTGCMEVHEKIQSTHETVTTGHAGGAYEPKNATHYDLENKEVFVLMDRGAQRSITSSGIQQRVLEDGRLEVVANIRNRENRRIQVQASCVFKDDQGFSTGDETPWQNLIFTENAQESVRFTSMNDKARRYTIRVREAR